MSLLSQGQIIRGTYEVERYLGAGAFAEVYRVKHRFLGRQAMKVFKMVGMTIDETEKMLGEALLLSRIGHPNIVRVFDANVVETSQGICGFFTMEYIAGGSLEQFWKSHGSRFVPIETAVEVARQVCRGLAAAHGETPPIVHRDIKPQNILVGYDGTGLRARVGDFGLARHVNPLTMMASARGTPVFKAPEVFRDAMSDSLSGDVWGVGATLYMLLTDQLPYACENEADLLSLRRFEKLLPPPSRFNPLVDAALDAIVLKSLAVEAARRYQDAREILKALEGWSPNAAAPAAPESNLATTDWRDSKANLGAIQAQLSETEAQRLAKKALELARQSGRLNEAADVMEEAFNKWPDLRSQYQSKVQLWRMGVAM